MEYRQLPLFHKMLKPLSYYARSIACLLLLLSFFFNNHLCSNCCICASKYWAYVTLSGCIWSGKPGAWVVWSGFAFPFPHMPFPYQESSEHPACSSVKTQRPKNQKTVCRKKAITKIKIIFKKTPNLCLPTKLARRHKYKAGELLTKIHKLLLKTSIIKHLKIWNIFRIEQGY